MRDWLDKFIYKIIVIIAVVLFVSAFRQMVYTDSSVNAFFSSLISQIPFSKLISDYVCKVLKFQNTLPIVVNHISILSDLLRLAIMACFQPLVLGLLTKIFLPLPRYTNQILMGSYKKYEIQEEYMNSLGYRIKSLILNVIAVPLLAILASYITSKFFSFISNWLGNMGEVILGTITVGIVAGISIIPLILGGVSLGTAILWRLVVTLLSNMVNTFATNALCVTILLTLISGVSSQIAGSIIALIVWLIIFDFGLQCLKRIIVS